MTRVQKLRIRIIAGIAGATILLLPITLGPDTGVRPNDACADGSCCIEIGSVCESGGDVLLNYYASLECGGSDR
ncbi:MAG: hypothetical protein R3314_08205 [Longimicrobiales bacterium]|nr:hypothetical protein [Longimicrobiales bacterium]